MALRRWKPFLDAFPLIDTAIEAADADGLLSRGEIRSARSRIIEMLCDAADDDDKAEALCALLDEAMAGSLGTLRAVPVERIALASGDGLVGAVVALTRDHASERVRGLARDVVRGWRAGAVAEFARARAEFARAKADMDVLDGLPSTPPPPPQDDKAPGAGSDAKTKKIPAEQRRPRKTAVVSSCRVSKAESYGTLPKKRAPVVSTSTAKPSSANTGAPAVVPARPKKTPPVVISLATEERKMEATKRKLQERYQEAEDAKRRRTIQVIKPPLEPSGQRQRNEHPALRARGPASCAAERRFMTRV
ncbi:hypothetical protein SETIT_2G376000v2 [Setaria italica]|uniref:TFIIS N-terminal domain-containing protein n=1 Tax=Setaria italica TaxID=4555 RepID=K4A1D2_SETIT|nr:uncharacterized protein LOC111256244 [Setaria italica]RCV13809.1 hypothetical protein SETIT_2G376000v2 [Setaria italica]